MAKPRSELENRVREQRARRGWSQDDLARRAGLSRAGVSALETGRLVPSTSAALSLAQAFGLRVEDLFSLLRRTPEGAPWAWPPPTTPCRYWQAEVNGQTRLYPAEATSLGVVPHDGVAQSVDAANAALGAGEPIDPSVTLVMACCDPAVGLLAASLAQSAGVRLLALSRSSRTALELLGQGLAHVAGVHLGGSHDGDDNAAAVRAALGPGFSLLRAATWEEGVAYGPARHLGSVGEALSSSLRWVGRETGSGARQCLDELLGDHRPPRRLANDHRGVAAAIRGGWADAGVCLRLAGEEAGLGFLPVRQEPYDLCFPETLRADPRIQALIMAVRSAPYRRLLGELPGYDSRETGEIRRVL